jgi:hypothetical protein
MFSADHRRFGSAGIAEQSNLIPMGTQTNNSVPDVRKPD